MTEREWIVRMTEILGRRKASGAARIVKLAVGTLCGSRITARFDWSMMRFTYMKTSGFGTEEHKPNYSITISLDG